ncbi:hypothetical protein ACFLYD_05545, partial [Chloroflexota bacterium]
MTTGHAARVSSDEQIAALMERGRDAAERGQRARARRYFAAVLEIDPACEEALLERAAVADDPQESMADLACVLTLNPGNQQARQALRAARKKVGNQPPYRGPGLLPVTPSPAPVAEPQAQRPWLRVWVVLAVVGLILL